MSARRAVCGPHRRGWTAVAVALVAVSLVIACSSGPNPEEGRVPPPTADGGGGDAEARLTGVVAAGRETPTDDFAGEGPLAMPGTAPAKGPSGVFPATDRTGISMNYPGYFDVAVNPISPSAIDPEANATLIRLSSGSLRILITSYSPPEYAPNLDALQREVVSERNALRVERPRPRLVQVGDAPTPTAPAAEDDPNWRVGRPTSATVTKATGVDSDPEPDWAADDARDPGEVYVQNRFHTWDAVGDDVFRRAERWALTGDGWQPFSREANGHSFQGRQAVARAVGAESTLMQVTLEATATGNHGVRLYYLYPVNDAPIYEPLIERIRGSLEIR
jgi:hypothetical protein